MLALLTPFAWGQKYSMTFVCPGAKQNDSVLYIGQHYRDGFITLDSASVDKDNTYTFSGRRKWSTGIYALYGKEAKKSMMDFTIDGSQKFSIRLTPTNEVADPQKDIVGSPANQAMYTYINKENWARKQARDIDKRKKSGDVKVKEEAERDM